MDSSDAMVVRELTVRGLGAIQALRLALRGGLDVVKQHPVREISFALQTVLNSKAILHSHAYFIREDSEITARVELAGTCYFITARPDRRRERFCLHACDAEGTDRTEEYLYLTSHEAAQDEAEIFDGESGGNARRLVEWDPESAEGALRCGGLFKLGSFRAYLRAFVRSFQAERLRPDKLYELYLRADGRYAVRHPLLGARVCLSESEQRIFRYLCFLHTAQFWHGFEGMRDLHTVKKPLILCGLAERLDESIDVQALLERTMCLGRQVILFTCPTEQRVKSVARWKENGNAVRMKRALLRVLEKSCTEAMEEVEIGDMSAHAPNLLLKGIPADATEKICDTVYAFAARQGIAVVEVDERDIDVERVRSRALYEELNGAATPTVLLIKNYGAACTQAREFLYSLAKNRLYPITNLWQPTVVERLLFTVALEAGETPPTDGTERAAFRVLDMRHHCVLQNQEGSL